MELKFIKHFYSDTGEYVIEVPDDIVFICDKDEIGHIRYDGFLHYLGCSKNISFKYKKDSKCNVINDFPGLLLFDFTNVIFKSNINIIDYKEFYDKFNFGSYYMFEYNKEEYLNNKIYPSELCSVSKILDLKSQYNLHLLTVTIRSWLYFDESECLGISTQKVDLFKFISSYIFSNKIKQNCESEFIDCINKVLSVNNYKVVSDQPSFYQVTTEYNKDLYDNPS